MTPRLLLAPLPTEEEAWRSATPEERAAAADFSVGRRREWLGWRALVRARLGSDLRFGYDAPSGSPWPTRRTDWRCCSPTPPAPSTSNGRTAT